MIEIVEISISEAMTYYLTGLDNLGNTCFMNCSLQALYATYEFQQYIKNRHNLMLGPLHGSLSQLFNTMMTCEEDFIRPEDFRNKFSELKPQFKNNIQHDTQEFLRILIDSIHEEINYAKKRIRREICEPKSAKEAWKQYVKYVDDSFLVKLFVGQLASTIKCTHCKHESVCWDTFWDLSLSLTEGNKECDINDCVKAYVAEEQLDKDSMPTCSQCKEKTKSIKSLKIVKSPLILIIQLKKFANSGQKISKNVTVNEEIYVNSTLYQLYACVCHYGAYSGSGHYTIFCKYIDSAKWYHFDDESIEIIDSLTSYHLKDAYILFYRMKGLTIK